MGSCNTVQNELGGKELLLKVCKEITVATAATGSDVTLTDHGLKVGDLVRPQAVGDILTMTVGTFYYVVAVTANTFQVSATRGGTPIVQGELEAALLWDAFQTLGGLRSKSFAFNSEAIDITNGDSDEWKKILDGAGIRSFSVSGSGVYTNEDVFQTAFTAARANELTCMAFIDVKAGNIFAGCFKVTSLEVSGDYDAESNYSISAESSGIIQVVLAA